MVCIIQEAMDVFLLGAISLCGLHPEMLQAQLKK